MKDLCIKAATTLANAKNEVIGILKQLPTEQREMIIKDTEQRLDEIISLIDGIADYSEE